VAADLNGGSSRHLNREEASGMRQVLALDSREKKSNLHRAINTLI